MDAFSTEDALKVVRRWSEQLGCTAPEAHEYRLATMADELMSLLKKAAKSGTAGGLNGDELNAACANIGYDLSCGACALLFFTGYTGPTARHDMMPPEHDQGCKTEKR